MILTDNIKSSLAIIYGQPDHRSTSFQTTQLSQALSQWFQPIPQRIKSLGLPKSLHSIERVLYNNILPRFKRPNSDYVLYCNDGAADLRTWEAKKIIYWYDAYEDWYKFPPSRLRWIHWLRYQNILAADYVFCVSHRQVEMAKQLRPGRENSVFYLPVGVNCKIFDPALAEPNEIRQRFNLPNKLIVGYLGYIGVCDGSFAGEPITEIATDLLRQNNVHFLIVGFGKGLPVFQERIKQLGLESHFTFTGYVADEILPSCISVMDICVDTLEAGLHSESRSETKLKQYMAMGRACVATNLGENCIDLDHGEAGILVDVGTQNLLDGITTLCNDAELRVKLGCAARNRAQSLYDWSILASHMIARLG
jgi:glycosyltransferase involved in cell wall biosynthesis